MVVGFAYIGVYMGAVVDGALGGLLDDRAAASGESPHSTSTLGAALGLGVLGADRRGDMYMGM